MSVSGHGWPVVIITVIGQLGESWQTLVAIWLCCFGKATWLGLFTFVLFAPDYLLCPRFESNFQYCRYRQV